MEQETEHQKHIALTNAANVPVENLEKVGAEKALVQYLIDERQGSNHFALRLYTVQKDGHTPLDEHPYEHHVYVLSGKGLLRESSDPNAPLKRLKAGDAVFIPSNAIHQFSNTQKEPFIFLCVKGNPQLYSDKHQGSKPDEHEQNFC